VKTAQQTNRAYSNSERNKILEIPYWCWWWKEQEDEISPKIKHKWVLKQLLKVNRNSSKQRRHNLFLLSFLVWSVKLVKSL